MRIDIPRTYGPQSTDTPETARGRAADARPRSSGADAVSVSHETQLVQDVVRTASEAPAIREAMVERARALVERGEVGTDLDRLADRMLDDLLEP